MAASVTLDRLYLSAASDLEDGIVTFSAVGGSDSRSVPVSVRTMANGRTRTVSRAGTSRTVTKTLRMLSLSDVVWLEDHRGQLVLLRDHAGRKVYGVYSEVQPQESRTLAFWDCPLTLVEVSHSEAVGV